MNIEGLITELKTDPLARGYAGMSNSEAFASLTTKNRTKERASLTGAQIYNAIDRTEWSTISNANQTIVRDVFGLGGDIDVRTGTNARAALLGVFGAGTTTRANLVALVTQSISRAEEIGCEDLTLEFLAYIRSINPGT